MAISANRLELLQIADAVARDKSIDKSVVLTAMEEAMQRAAKAHYGTENDIKEFLKGTYEALSDVLQKMEGKIEFGLKVNWDKDQVVKEIENENEEIRRLKEEIQSNTSTSTYFSRMQLGRMALLSVNGVRAVVSSRKQQAADRSMFRHLGLEPAEQSILALKSSVHFRADFQPIAAEILIVAAPGSNPVDHLALPYRHLRDGVRLMPMGPAFRR